MEELELSRTPFREAINELVQENMIEIVPYKGMFVTEITIKDIEDLYAIREKLEPFVVELCMNNIPKDVVESYYKSMSPPEDLDPSKSVREDEDLHMMLLKYVNNSLLERTMLGFYDHSHRIRVLSTNKEQVAITKQQHLKIVECMHKGDKAGAIEAMHQHIVSSKQRAFDTLMRHKDRIYLK
jgi:DNA-binding GntR family transcriptional regulator